MKVQSRRHFAWIFAALFAIVFALPVALSANDLPVDREGYLQWDSNSDCLLIKTHEGSTLFLSGNIDGLQEDDHVLISTRLVEGADCGDSHDRSYQVVRVLALWADDRHKSTYYDHETDGSFASWVAQNR